MPSNDEYTRFNKVAVTGLAMRSGGVDVAVTATPAEINNAHRKPIMIPLGAVSATTTFSVLIAPAAGYLTACRLVTKDAIAAHDTNYWTVTLTNGGIAGAGTDKIGERTTKITGGTAFAARTMWDIGALDTTHRTLAAGTVVTLTLTKDASATAFAEAALLLEFVYS